MPLGWHWKMAERLLWRIFCLLKSKARTAESWVNHGTTSTVWNWRWGPRLASRRHRGAFKEPWMGGTVPPARWSPLLTCEFRWHCGGPRQVHGSPRRHVWAAGPGHAAPLTLPAAPALPPPVSRCPPDPSLPPWPLLLPAVTSALEKLCSYGLRPRHRFGTYPRGLILLPAISLYYILLFQF